MKTQTKYKVNYDTATIEVVEVFGAEKHHYYIQPDTVIQKKCRQYKVLDTQIQAFVYLFNYLLEKEKKQAAQLEETRKLLKKMTCD